MPASSENRTCECGPVLASGAADDDAATGASAADDDGAALEDELAADDEGAALVLVTVTSRDVRSRSCCRERERHVWPGS